MARCPCGSIIKIIPGHRPRRYCSDRCKQIAYRRRHGQKARPVSEREIEAWRAANVRIQLEKRWSGLSFRTYSLLQEVQDKYGPALAAKIAETIVWEANKNRQS